MTVAELLAYEKARDEIRQVLEIAAARWAEGKAEGETVGFTKGETAGFTKGETAGVVKGKVEGKVEALLAILAARGVSVDHEVRARIEACKDAATLEQWIVRAVTAASAEEVISEHG